jgi:hypothetical protein
MFAGITADCNAEASLSGSKWSIKAHLTTLAANKASQEAGINAIVASEVTLGTAMVSALAQVGAEGVLMVVSNIAVVVEAAGGYLATVLPAMADKPYRIALVASDAIIAGTGGQPAWSELNETSYNTAFFQTLVQLGFPSAYIGVDWYKGTPITSQTLGQTGSMTVNFTAYVPLTSINTSAASIQWMVLNMDAVTSLFIEKLAVTLPVWKGASFSWVSNVMTSYPDTMNPNGVSVTMNGSAFTGQDPATAGVSWSTVLYDLDGSEDGSEDAGATASKNASAAWFLPVAGVFGLFILISFIGVRRRSKQEPLSYTSLKRGELAEQDSDPLVNQSGSGHEALEMEEGVAE